MPAPLWQPSPDRVANSNMSEFMEAVADDWNVAVNDYSQLHRFSIEAPEKFWASLKDYAGVIAETWGGQVLAGGGKMPGAKWFPGARLNFAENLLRRLDDADALVFWGEDKVKRRLSHGQLHRQVSRLAAALAGTGVGPGDRVAGYLPNMPEAVIAMLAAASLGAVWSSCSPDFGVQGVVDRFGQIKPKVLFAADGYRYNAKTHHGLDKLGQILGRLETVERAVVVPYVHGAVELDGMEKALWWDDFIAGFEAGEIPYRRLPFDHPLYILYSSGTTGAPK